MIIKNMVTKTPTTKSTTAKAPKKPKAIKKKVEASLPPAASEKDIKPVEAEAKAHAPKISARYIFATGRRKTSVANVRLFEGHGKLLVNKKPFETYFSYGFYRETALKPFDVTGLAKNHHFTAQINGGGIHSQAQALSHGLATALSKSSDEVRKVLKKNGLLTRDDRKKERKKPGLKRARRAPQWAKR